MEQPSGETRSIPDLAPIWWMRISMMPAHGPPTRPSFARNSSMILVLKSLAPSAAEFAMISSNAQKRHSPSKHHRAVLGLYACVGQPFLAIAIVGVLWQPGGESFQSSCRPTRSGRGCC